MAQCRSWPHRATNSGALAAVTFMKPSSSLSSTPAELSTGRALEVYPTNLQCAYASAGEGGRSVLGSRAAGCGSGKASMPSPSAACLASPSSTFSRPPTFRLRISRFWHLLSSKVNASTMCRRSTSVWLRQNCRAWL